jgi:hypothetical protein
MSHLVKLLMGSVSLTPLSLSVINIYIVSPCFIFMYRGCVIYSYVTDPQQLPF